MCERHRRERIAHIAGAVLGVWIIDLHENIVVAIATHYLGRREDLDGCLECTRVWRGHRRGRMSCAVNAKTPATDDGEEYDENEYLLEEAGCGGHDHSIP